MEKVQFQLEATLPELKDLHEKGLFSRDEIDQITRRRTHLETSLIRQGVRKEDFFKYAEYEINLEKLRKVRWKRLGYAKNPPPPSASLFSIPRRTMYILKRATVKFPGDLATWLAYVEYAGREGMRKIVTKGLTSALQHHPLSSTLYLLSSFHHVHPGAPFPRSSIPSASTLDLPSASADVKNEDDDEEDSKPGSFALEGTQPARTTLLLGLRMLPTNPDLWREYIKLELGWVEALRRRWKVLGINNTSAGEVGEGSFGPDGEDARKAILGGQLVLQAIKSALAAMPISSTSTTANMEFRDSILYTLRTYPSPLRSTCLEVVYDDLGRIAEVGGRAGAQARLQLLTKGLYDQPYEAGRKDTGGVTLSGVELVEELGKIGKEIRKGAKIGGAEFGEVAGLWLDQQIRENQSNSDLSAYLLSILVSLTKPSLHPTPTLLLLHLSHAESSSSPSEHHDLVTKYASLHPLHPELQLALLRSIIDASSPSPAIRSLAERLIKSFDQSSLSTSDSLIVRQIWTTWASYEISTNTEEAMNTIWSKILRMSLGIHGTSEIHNDLLILYFDWKLRDTAQGISSIMSAFRSITSKYRPSPIFFAHALGRIVDGGDKKDILRCHESWRSVCVRPEDKVNEGLAIAEALISVKMVREAIGVVEVVRSEVREKAVVLGDLERRWKGMMDDLEDDEGDSESDEEEEEMKIEEGEMKVEIGDSLENLLGVVGTRDSETGDVLMT